MKNRTLLTRIIFMVAAAVVLLALSLQAVTWYHTGTGSGPFVVNMLGLLLLTIVGAKNPASKRARLAWSFVAILLICPSAILIWFQGRL